MNAAYTLPYVFNIHFNIILSIGLLHSCSETESLCAFFLSPVRSTYLTNVIPIDLINIRESGREYKLFGSLPVVKSSQTAVLSVRLKYICLAVAQPSQWNFYRRLYDLSFRRGGIKYLMFPVGRSLIMPPGVMIVSTSTPYQERRRCCTFIET
jgi:hypothetical protein